MGFYQDMAKDRLRQANAADGVRPKYKVLQASMIKQADREKAAAVASFIRSKDEAFKLEGQEGFSYFDLDTRGRCAVIKYHGVEVALLFERIVVEREPGPAEPVPERPLTSPYDAWIQIDLLNTDDVEAKKGVGDKLRHLMAQNNRLQMLWKSEESQRKQFEEQLAKRVDERAELKALREKVAMLEARLKISEKESESWKRETMTQKEERKSDKVGIIRSLMPVFETLWLAGRHRVNDQLYGMLAKQMVDGLGSVSVTLIQPEEGDAFDPEIHHAVHTYPFATGSREIGTVVKIHKVGWRAGSLVYEAAMVAVGVERAEEEKSGKQNIAVGGGAVNDNVGGAEEKVSGGS